MKLSYYFIRTIFMVLILLAVKQSTFGQENSELSILLLNHEYQSVIDILERKILNKDSLSFFEYNSLGSSYYKLMNFGKAIPHLYKASKLYPENIPNLILLGNCYSSAGNFINAKISYEKVLSIDALNKTAMINLAKVFMDLDQFTDASIIYQNLVNADSSNSYFYAQLGLCELKNGNEKDAIMSFEQSLELNSGNTNTVLMLAKLYYNNKEYESAIKILKEGLSQNSQNKQLNKMLGDVFYKKDQFNEAIIKYLYATTLGDTTANIYQKIGITYYYLSFTSIYLNTETRKLKLEEGIEALIRAIQKDENDPVNSLYLGLCYKELQNYEEAVKYLEQSLNHVFPEYIDEIYYNLGVSYGATKNYIKSIKAYKEALSYDLNKTNTYFSLANIYDNYYSDKSVAVLYYKKFVSESEDADEKLIGYSLNRIKTLSQESNFWGK